ncbi:MAG: ABC transporter permease [Gemmatimonadota bacterium]
MDRLRHLMARVLGRPSDRDADEELRFHFEMRVRDYMAGGMSEPEARAAARDRIGDERRITDACDRIDERAHRRESRRAWLAELAQDVRYGLRSLRRAPVFTLVAVGTLTVGIGATTAIFSVVDAVLLAPLPYAHPDRLVRIWETSPQGTTRNVVSSGNVVDWQENASSFDIVAAQSGPYGVSLTGRGDAARVRVLDLEPEAFSALGTPPRLGRTLLPADGAGGDAVVLAHAFWQTRFGGDAAVLGDRVVLNDVPHTVVGVMPPGFDYPTANVDLWRAMPDDRLDPTERTSHNFSVIGLLREGVSVGAAQAEMSQLARAIAEEHPAQMTGWGVNVVPFHADLTRNVRTLLLVLLGGVGVVLLIVCGNLANLLLARAASREREMAVRGAMGAGRGRIMRQLLTESGLLAVLGGIGAAVLAPALLRVLVSAAPADVPLLGRASVDLRVLGFAAAVSFGCAALFGLAPALRLARTDLDRVLRGTRTTSGAGHVRLRDGLLVGQVAFSVVLLVGAGLFIQSFRAVTNVDPGFDPEALTVMELDLPFGRYGDIDEQVAFYDGLLERVRAIPGVTEASASSWTPASGQSMTMSFAIEGREATNPSGREDDEPLVAVQSRYFETLRQAVIEGRTLGPTDGPEGAPVAVISESLARKHWPAGGAVGSRMAFRVGETPWREIVGVVADARLAGPDIEPGPVIYIPYAQKSWPWLTWMGIVVRRADGVDEGSVVPRLRAVLADADPALPPHALTTIERRFEESTARRAFAMTLVGGFGALALGLSLIGLYGVLGYTLSRQRREIGLRIAVGAGTRDIVGRVLGRSLALTMLGAAAGVVASVMSARLVESLLYGVSPTEPRIYVVIVVGVATVGLLTALGPAWRAARTDPLQVLTAE